MRTRGAHRHPRPAAAAVPDPVRVGGPRRWVVSVGVLAVVAAICGAGAYALRDSGGDGSLAAVSSGADTAQQDGATPWTTSTLTAAPGEGSDGGGTDPSDAASGPSASGPAADDVTSADDGGVPTADGAGVPGVDGALTGAGAGAVASAAGTPAADDVAADIAPVDRDAGIATRNLVQVGSGRLLVVPGQVPAPRNAPSMRVRVEIEEGIGADGPAFASFVLATLNDDRSWGHGGALTFSRTDGPADVRVVLASPQTSARLCAPALTRGTMSCGGGDKAVLTMFRWLNGIPDYGTDRTAYRHYLVNHEVGHVLGHSHAYCTPGHLAPVMVQQTKGLHGCLPNAWPFPANR